MHLRLPVPLLARIKAFQREHDLSQNTAVIMLVAAALDAHEDRKRAAATPRD